MSGLPRLNLKNYADARLVTLKAEGLQKAEICVHRNATLGICQCEKEKWQVFQKGQWSLEMSPYEDRYIDVMFKDKAAGSVTVSLEEEFQRWRLVCLGIGLILLLAAPVVSSWAPFYYSSSMTLGVLLLVLIIFFQGMKLLPMGRKNFIYITVFGSLVGVGSLIVDYFSTMVNSTLMNLGISDEMHNPVSVFLLVGIVLAGAALGHWIVRKYILSEDGSVDMGVAQFVRWAMRFTAAVFISQSTLDALLGLVALCISVLICYLITSRKWRSPVKQHHTHLKTGTLWTQKARQASAGRRNAEFLSPPTRKDLVRNVRQRSNGAYAYSNSPLKAPMLSMANTKPANEDEVYYSTFHKTPAPRRFSKQEWEDFTRESTREALQEWAASPEVSRWIADNANQIQFNKHENSDDSMESSSGSSEETEVENDSGLNFFRW